MRLLSHPFRLEGGAIATVEQGSDDATTELIAKLMMTRRGERHMAPMYGTLDPAFFHYDLGNVQLGLSIFGPNVEVTDIIIDTSADGVQTAEVIWS